MRQATYNVLFLCTGNSARSIMAEALLNEMGQGRFKAYSAGSHAVGAVNRFALDLLRRNGHPTNLLRSKNWDEFAKPGAPRLDFVFTVCDNAAGEVCPIWPGQPTTAHWGFPDPAAFKGSDAETAAHFAEVYAMIRNRISLFVALPFELLDRLSITQKVRALGDAVPAPRA
jgi:arsenate reductase